MGEEEAYFPAPPSSPTRRHPAASNCALPFERKGLAQGTAAQEEVRKEEEEEELSPPGAWKDAGSLPAPGRAPRENDGLFSKGGIFLITQHTALPLLFLERESRVSVSGDRRPSIKGDKKKIQKTIKILRTIKTYKNL